MIANKVFLTNGNGGGKRDSSIDILKGIGIILVLVAHSLGGYVHSFAYSFHMPLFFIVAGYFCKGRPIMVTMRKDFERLFVPFFFTVLVMFVAALFLYPLAIKEIKTPHYIFETLVYGNSAPNNHHKIWGNWAVVGSVWFLPALFWAKTVFNVMLNKLSMKHIVILTLLIGGGAALIGQYILLPYSFLEGMTALPFLLTGYMVKNIGGIRKFKKNVSSKNYYMAIMIFIIMMWFVSTFHHWLSIAGCNWSLYYFPNIILAIGGTYVCWLFSELISKHTYYTSKILSFLGVYSILLVCFPVIETYIIPLKTIIPNMPMKSVIIISCKVLWCMITMYAAFRIPVLRRVFSIK